MPAELLRGVPHQAYHQDSLPGSPRFSRSVAVTMLHQSALHAYQAHPKLGGGVPDEPTDVMDKGSLVHALLLGSGPEIVRVEFKDWRKDAAQAERDAARERGALPVLAHLLDEATDAADELRTRLLDFEVILGDPRDSEVTILWDEGGVPCKCRIDHYPGGAWVWDLKVQRNLSVPQFEWGIRKQGLDVQAWAYSSAVAAVHPELAGRVNFEWILCERKPPYDLAIVSPAPSMLSLGEMRWRRGLKAWRECMASGKWPGTGRRPPVEARPFDLEDEMTVAVASVGEPDWIKGETDGSS